MKTTILFLFLIFSFNIKASTIGSNSTNSKKPNIKIKNHKEKCEEFQRQLFSYSGCSSKNTLQECLSIIETPPSIDIESTSMMIINAKNQNIIRAINQIGFNDNMIKATEIKLKKSAVNASRHDLNVINSQIRTMEGLKKLRALNFETEIIKLSSKACKNIKCNIEAYNSQIRTIQSQINENINNEHLKNEMLTFFPLRDREKLFGPSDKKQNLLQIDLTSLDIGQNIDKDAFTNYFSNWISRKNQNPSNEKDASLKSKFPLDERLNMKSCCLDTNKSFWCQGAGIKKMTMALFKSSNSKTSPKAVVNQKQESSGAK